MSWVKDSSQKTKPDNEVKHVINNNEIISDDMSHSEKIISTKWLIIVAFVTIIIGMFNL